VGKFVTLKSSKFHDDTCRSRDFEVLAAAVAWRITQQTVFGTECREFESLQRTRVLNELQVGFPASLFVSQVDFGA
jgi:hypothetical protein